MDNAFKTSGEQIILPEPTMQGWINFLSGSFTKGIGKVYATKIVEKFGSEIAAADFDFASRLKETGLIPDKNLESFAESVRGLKVSPRILALLYSTGLKDAEIEKIISHYGKRVSKILEWDPYDMVENVWKFSFFSADRIGRFFGIENDDPRRLKGAVLTSVKFYAEEGNMYATTLQVLHTTSRLTGISEDRIAPVIDILVEEGRIVKDLEGLYLPVYFKAEEEAARKIKSLIAFRPREEKHLVIPEKDIQGHTLSKDQKEAIETVMKNRVTVITGGPGTGKTTAIRGLISIFMDMDKKVVLTAPTGRAAKKMTDLTGEEAKTIHRLLGYSMGRGYKNKKFEADILVVDEASMLEQVLFNHLLQAVGDETRIVLVGDTNQLPAIGAGNVLKDMIDSGEVPVINLEENFRQKDGSMIAFNAFRIKEGNVPDKTPSEDFVFLPEKNAESIKNRLVSLLTKEIPSYTGIDPKEIQVVTPQQEGPLGARQLNMELQELLNPAAPELKKGIKKFRLGDRVMQTSNSSERGIYNGETGWVSEIDTEREFLTVSFFDGKKSLYSLKDLKELSLSYATTVHKLQGSETDYMVLVLSTIHKPLLYRNLIYTGVSRAKKLCVITGEEKALEMAVTTADKDKRNSNFIKRLQ